MKTTQPTQEKELCPICKNGMTCESVIGHASKWNTMGGKN